MHDDDSRSIHDLLIEQVEKRYIPDNAPLPDLLDVLLLFCRSLYGENARSVAIQIIERQKQKGLERYGQLLTRNTRINPNQEAGEELADAAAYQYQDRLLRESIPINEALLLGAEYLERAGDRDAAMTLMKLNHDLTQTAHAAIGDFMEEELLG